MSPGLGNFCNELADKVSQIGTVTYRVANDNLWSYDRGVTIATKVYMLYSPHLKSNGGYKLALKGISKGNSVVDVKDNGKPGLVSTDEYNSKHILPMTNGELFEKMYELVTCKRNTETKVITIPFTGIHKAWGNLNLFPRIVHYKLRAAYRARMKVDGDLPTNDHITHKKKSIIGR